MEKAPINSITRLRIHSDGVGVRSVVFMQNCPLSCFWCCNPETRTGTDCRTLTPEALYRYIAGDIPYFLASSGGITFSGGEPLLHSSFLHTFISRYCQDFSVDLETSLYTSRQVLESLLPLIHTWNVDFKVFDPDKHRSFTGVSNQKILDNLAFLASQISADRIILTYPVIPNYNDSEENILAMIGFMKKHGLYQVELHPYRKIAEEKQRKASMSVTPVLPLCQEQMSRIQNIFQESSITLLHRSSLYGKEKCRYLKALRKQLCRDHGFSVEIPECTFNGECVGTCPQCEYELKQIRTLLSQKISIASDSARL